MVKITEAYSDEEIREANKMLSSIAEDVEAAFSTFETKWDVKPTAMDRRDTDGDLYVQRLCLNVVISGLIFEFNVEISNYFARKFHAPEATFRFKGHKMTTIYITPQVASDILEASKIAEKLQREITQKLEKYSHDSINESTDMDETDLFYIGQKVLSNDKGEISVKCLDLDPGVDGLYVEKWIGQVDDPAARNNAKALLRNPQFSFEKDVRNELISTFGLEDFGFKIEESSNSRAYNVTVAVIVDDTVNNVELEDKVDQVLTDAGISVSWVEAERV